MAKIEDIEGIGPAYAEKLAQAGIVDCAGLLEQGAAAAGRQKICESTGISLSLVLRWVNHADLFRISGIGPQYAELLEAAGVDTVVELAQRVPANLHAKLTEVQEQKGLTGRVPAASFVADWVEQAKQLPKVVTH